ncbi:MAG: hypothetical protein ACK5LC_15020 [Coprobacillaceae bacterium]
MMHLAYCDNVSKEIQKIIDGSKTMVVRGAAARKFPHSRVFEGETIYFMEKGTGKITVKATVDYVENLVKLTEDEINTVFEKHQERLQLTDKQKERWHKKTLCFVGFKDVEEIEPLEFDKQGNMDDWLIIEKIEDVVVGTSIPFTYVKLGK